MAEFIFDIQRFDDGDGDGDGGDTGSDTSTTGDTTSTESATAGTSGSSGSSSSGSSSSSSSGSGGTSGTSVGSGGGGPGNTGGGGRNSSGGYSYSQWNAIYYNAVDNYDAAVELGTVNDFYGTYGVADNFLVSRYAINEIFNVDQFDTITFTDANSWDFVAYNYRSEYDDDFNVIGSDLAIALNLTSDVDSGAGSLTRIHYSDAYASGSDYFSPTITFANESLLYSNTTGWTTPEQVAFSEYFWSTCLGQSGTTDFPDVISASRGVNNYITNVDSNDTILLADTKLFDDLHSADYVGNGVALTFNNGTAAFIEYSGTFSPTIQLASGESFVYNSRMGAWRTPAEAAVDAAVLEQTFNHLYATSDSDLFPVTRLTDTVIDDTQGSDRIIFIDDTTVANLTSIAAEGDYLTLTFDTGTTMLVEYTSILSPTFEFADGSKIGYDWNTGLWNTAYRGTDEIAEEFDISRNANSFVYHANYNDLVYFVDATAANVTDLNVNNYIYFTFDTGMSAGVASAAEFSPTFMFADGSLVGYDYNTGTWGAPYYGTDAVDEFALSIGANSLVYDAGAADAVLFVDGTVDNITNINANELYINLTFDTGATTSVLYTDWYSPDFVFADGSRYYYSSTIDDEGNFTGTWVTHSADTAASADLWGDTFTGTSEADNLFVGTYANTIVQNVDAQDSVTFDAALSDIVATSVEGNTIAVAFTSGTTAVIQTAGDSPTFNLASGESFIYDRQAASWKSA